jgi:hypothetical protein
MFWRRTFHPHEKSLSSNDYPSKKHPNEECSGEKNFMEKKSCEEFFGEKCSCDEFSAITKKYFQQRIIRRKNPDKECSGDEFSDFTKFSANYSPVKKYPGEKIFGEESGD